MVFTLCTEMYMCMINKIKQIKFVAEIILFLHNVKITYNVNHKIIIFEYPGLYLKKIVLKFSKVTFKRICTFKLIIIIYSELVVRKKKKKKSIKV